MKYPDLDAAFLKYTGVVSDRQRAIQSFYLSFFADCERVIDLACGQGDFVSMLAERGVEAVGVDSDASCVREASARGVRAVQADVFEYLKGVEPDSVDGIFSAHLVEHLPYEKVLDLFALARQALRPSGVIVVATPNVRALYPHLESFYAHFGHVSFYHPQLLSFFLHYLAFADIEDGENPNLRSPLWGHASARLPVQPDAQPITPLSLERVMPLLGPSWLSRLKLFVLSLAMSPERLIGQVNTKITEVNHRLIDVAQVVSEMQVTMDRSIECYVHARKPLAEQAS